MCLEIVSFDSHNEQTSISLINDHFGKSIFYKLFPYIRDHLCGLVVRVPGYRSRGPGFDSKRYQVFWEVVGLERGPFSLVSTIEELLGRNSSGSGLETREYGSGDPLSWPRDTLYPQKLALTSPTSGGRPVGIVHLRTKTTEFLTLEIFKRFTFIHVMLRVGSRVERQPFQELIYDHWFYHKADDSGRAA
jgi:hypothetical protein